MRGTSEIRRTSPRRMDLSGAIEQATTRARTEALLRRGIARLRVVNETKLLRLVDRLVESAVAARLSTIETRAPFPIPQTPALATLPPRAPAAAGVSGSERGGAAIAPEPEDVYILDEGFFDRPTEAVERDVEDTVRIAAAACESGASGASETPEIEGAAGQAGREPAVEGAEERARRQVLQEKHLRALTRIEEALAKVEAGVVEMERLVEERLAL